MKKHISPAIRLTMLTILLFAVAYPLLVWLVAQSRPSQGKGELIYQKGKAYYANVGQAFSDDKYFWSRPSMVDYNAAGSAGSNKGPTNEEYLAQVQSRIDTILAHNPGLVKSDIPVDMITASGSGLDPHISLQAAMIQVTRVASARNLERSRVEKLVCQQMDKPLWGVFGPEKINVLKLNLALDRLN